MKSLNHLPMLMLLIGGMLFPNTVLKAQVKSYSFEEVESLMKVAPRPIFVMMHTDWCRWCQVMKKTTLKDEQVVELLNENFYFVSFDAESKEDIRFNGHTFKSQANSLYEGTHDLAVQLGEIDGSLAYPALAFLNPAYEITFQHNGFLNKKQFRKVLEKMTE